jgi:hypothetical protein
VRWRGRVVRGGLNPSGRPKMLRNASKPTGRADHDALCTLFMHGMTAPAAAGAIVVPCTIPRQTRRHGKPESVTYSV